MKYIITLIVALILSVPISAQKVVRNGNTFKTEKTSKSDVLTPYFYTDKDGKTYPVWISKNGSLYIKRISKSGKEYKKYLPKDVQSQIKQCIQ